MSERLHALARRVEDDGYFLASALAEFAASEGLDRQELASLLGCDIERLEEIALCRRPRSDTFASDVDRIAERFSIVPGTLAEIVRRADTLAAWRDAGAAGWLEAARDRLEHDR